MSLADSKRDSSVIVVHQFHYFRKRLRGDDKRDIVAGIIYILFSDGESESIDCYKLQYIAADIKLDACVNDLAVVNCDGEYSLPDHIF